VSDATGPVIFDPRHRLCGFRAACNLEAPSRLFAAATFQPTAAELPSYIINTRCPDSTAIDKRSDFQSPTMADIKIDSKAFQERLSHFVGAWKADKRNGDALFGGVSSIVILMGKVDEEPELHKNNAMHVCLTEHAMTVWPRGANVGENCSSGCLATSFLQH
jgi:hypothetical protein